MDIVAFQRVDSLSAGTHRVGVRLSGQHTLTLHQCWLTVYELPSVKKSPVYEGRMSQPHPRYRCHFSGAVLPAWLPVPKQPDGAMLLYHLSQHHPDQVGPYLVR